MMSMRIKDILKKKVLLALSAGILSFSFVSLSYAMPVQDATKQFDATTSESDSIMNIAGVKTNNVLNWKSFDIANGETVKFDAGAQTKNYLNLIHDVKASEIFGTLTGGNNVYLINPNGVLFGAGSSVNVGNLHVSTRALSEVDVDNFSSSGANPLSTAASSAAGDITNMGNLVANKVVLEGNNILLQNSAALKNPSGAQLQKLNEADPDVVVLKAMGDIDVGHESSKGEVTEVNDIQFSAEDEAVYKSTAKDLKWTTTDLAGNSKSATDYKLIHNVYELQNMKNNLSGNYMLANDIDAQETKTWNKNENYDSKVEGSVEYFGFLPIGSGDADFTGKFQGANQTINKLYINRPDQVEVGLISVTRFATVKDVGLIDSDITGCSSVGSLVGHAFESTVIGYNTGSVSGKDECVGGLVGNINGSTVTGYNTGNVSGQGDSVGGLVGYGYASTVTGYNTGDVSGQGDYVGGLVGYGYYALSVTGYNTGAVNGQGKYVGGLAGFADGSTVTGHNTGNVSGSGNRMGGLVGYIRGSAVTGYNTGTISGGGYVGGLVGFAKGDTTARSTITGYNTGEVNGSGNYIGGLVGCVWENKIKRNNPIVTGYNTGAVNGLGECVGGFAGHADINVTTTGFYDCKINDEDLFKQVYMDLIDKPESAKKIISYEQDVVWDISNEGGAGKTWRLYEGYTYPLLNKAVVSRDQAGDPIYYEFLKPLCISVALDYTYDGSTDNFESFTKNETKDIFDTLYKEESILGFDENKIKFNTELSKNVGNYEFEIPELYSTQEGYDIVSEGVLQVIPREIEVLANVKDKPYDGTTSADIIDYELGNILDDDKECVKVTGGTAEFADKNAGENKIVNVNGLKLEWKGPWEEAYNYKIAYPVSTTASIDPLEISVSASGNNKTYDGTNKATVNYSSEGVISGDQVEFSGNALFADKNAGTGIKISVTGIEISSGADKDNYVLKNTSVETIANIERKGITVTATGNDKTYDGNDIARVNYSSEDIIAGDDVEFFGSAKFADKNAGADKKIIITRIDISGGADRANYDLINNTAETSAEIYKQPITITATVNDKTYDGTPDAEVTKYSLSGVLDDDKTKVSVANGTATFDDKKAGDDKVVNVTGLTLEGDEARNYSIAGPVSTTASILKKAITLKAFDDEKVYDKQAYANETVKVLDKEGKEFELFAGDSFTTLNATSEGKNVGNYDIVVNYAINDGNGGNNYDVTAIGAKLDITAAPLTITASDYSKIYDGTTATENKFAQTGLVDGDEITGVVTEFADKDAGENKAISFKSYIVNDGNGGNNYNLKLDEAEGVIYKADLTLTADPATSIMGQPIEKLSGKASGFVSGEGLEEDLLTWTTDATPSSMVGNYAINGSINDAYLATYSKNYNIKQAESNAKAYSITSNEQEKIAGYLAQEADYNLIVRAVPPASNVQETLLEVSKLKKGSEPTEREGVGLSEESKANLK